MSKQLTARDFARVKYCWFDGCVVEVRDLFLRQEAIAYEVMVSRVRTFFSPRGKISVVHCKPILRRKNNMTEQEYSSWISSFMIDDNNGALEISVSTRAKSIDYLDSIQVDCRDWIDAGLAIDAATLGELNPFKQKGGGNE